MHASPHDTQKTKIVQSRQGKEIYTALVEGIQKMKKQGADRVVLYIGETEPKKVSGFHQIKNDYYPFEFLHGFEQDFMMKENHYEIISLVMKNVGAGTVAYAGAGLEYYRRTRIIPMLPKLKKESNLNYVSDGGAWTKISEITKFIEENAVPSGWTGQMIREQIIQGIELWHDKTRELMEASSEHISLRLAGTYRSPVDEVMEKLRAGKPELPRAFIILPE